MIAEDWIARREENAAIHNGPILTVIDTHEITQETIIELRETNYTHYLANRTNDFEAQETCRSVAVNLLPTTADGRILIAKTSTDSGFGGKAKFFGGACDLSDVNDVGELEPTSTLRRELNAEFPGLLQSARGEPKVASLVVSGNGRQLVILYAPSLRLTETEARNLYTRGSDLDTGVDTIISAQVGAIARRLREGTQA